MDCSYFGQRDGACAVNDKGTALVHLAPDLKAKLIPRTNHIVRRHWNIVDRRKRRRGGIKEAGAEDGQRAAGASCHNLLELCKRRSRRRDCDTAGLLPIRRGWGGYVCLAISRGRNCARRRGVDGGDLHRSPGSCSGIGRCNRDTAGLPVHLAY